MADDAKEFATQKRHYITTLFSRQIFQSNPYLQHMGDTYIAIVPRISQYPDRKKKAQEILEWLVKADIVVSEKSNNTLDGDGYSISRGASAVVSEPSELPFELTVNGMRVFTEREVVHTGQFEPETVSCPACNEDISDGGDLEFIESWASGESDDLQCPHCGHTAEIHQFEFDIQWGFSDLGFVFWNWSEFTEEFIKEFSHKLACEVDIIYAKI